MADFSHLLNTKAEDVKELPVLPQGQYIAQVGQYEFKQAKTKKGDRPVVEVPLRLTQAISVAGEVPPRLPEIKHTFWLTNDEGAQDEYTLNNLKTFLEACGVDFSDPSKTIGQGITEISGAQVGIDIKHSPNEKNPARPYANVASFAKV